MITNLFQLLVLSRILLCDSCFLFFVARHLKSLQCWVTDLVQKTFSGL